MLDSPPLGWNSAEVARRMVEAADVLRRMRERIGPKAFGSNWPSVVHDKPDENDPQAKAQLQEDREFAAKRAAEMPTSDEISRMEEALFWPAAYLTHAIDADAVTFWATCVAHKLSIAAQMRKRRAAAEANAIIEQEAENRRREGLRREEAKKAAAWANQRLVGADETRAARIRINAQIRLQRACEDIMPVAAKPVSPNETISKRSLYRHMNYALDVIARELLARRVPFRPAPLDEDEDIRSKMKLSSAA